MLREAGYSTKEILEAVRKVRKDKEQSIVSFHKQKFDAILERVETVKDVVRPLNCRRGPVDSFPLQ